jgi:hypothetical protein
VTDGAQDRHQDADEQLMTRQPLRIVLASLLYLAGLVWIVNSNPWSGPVLVKFTQSHGVHMNDWFTFALWFGAVMAAVPDWANTTIRLPLRVAVDRSR